jgi:hypothetical protein
MHVRIPEERLSEQLGARAASLLLAFRQKAPVQLTVACQSLARLIVIGRRLESAVN